MPTSLQIRLPVYALLVLSAVVNTLKALPYVAQGIGFAHWEVTYRHGFVRRGLVGTLFQLCEAGHALDVQRTHVMMIHLVLTFGLVVQLAAFWRDCERTEPKDAWPLRVAVASFALSGFLPTAMDLAGYYDAFLFVILAASAHLLWRGRFLAAGLVAFVGPFVHDGFLFLWLGVLVLGVRAALDEGHEGRALGRRIAPLLLPLLAVALVMVMHSPSAANRIVEELHVDEGIRDSFRNYQFGLSTGRALQIMVDKVRAMPEKTALGLLAFGAPAYLLAACAYVADAHPKRWVRAATAVLATFAPWSILLVAWDLSRLVVWAMLSGLLAVFARYAPTSSRTIVPTAPRFRVLASAAVAVFAAFAWTPRVYAYFEIAFATVNFGPKLLVETPTSKATYAFLGWWNRKVFARSLDSAPGCTLVALPGAHKMSEGCAVELDEHGDVELPPEWLVPGRYEARVETERCGDDESATFAVVPVDHYRFRDDRAPTEGRAGTPLVFTFERTAKDSSLGQCALHATARTGCTRVTRMTLKKVD